MVAAGQVRARAVCQRVLVGAFESGNVINCAAWLLVLRAVVAFGRGVVMMCLVGVRSMFDRFELCIICLGDEWAELWR